MALSSLDDKAAEPVAADLVRVLGSSEKVWRELISRMEAAYGPLTEDWSFSGAKYGWILRLKRKKRVVLYLTPQLDEFLVGVVLGDRALTLLRQDDLDPKVRSLIDEAPRYGEGTGFRIPVPSAGDIPDIEVIIEAKMS